MGRFTARGLERVSWSARTVAMASLLLATGMTVQALAHHPGSHAVRQGDGRVRLQTAASASDACTTIQSVTLGAPPAVKAVPGITSVTVRLQRPAGAVCATTVTALHEETMLDVPDSATALLVYVVGPDGSVVASEKVPINR